MEGLSPPAPPARWTESGPWPIKPGNKIDFFIFIYFLFYDFSKKCLEKVFESSFRRSKTSALKTTGDIGLVLLIFSLTFIYEVGLILCNRNSFMKLILGEF